MRCSVALLLLATVGAAWPANAQPDAPAAVDATFQQRREQARPLAKSAFADFRAGNYADAISGFERAEALFHAPVHLLYLARAHDKLGDWRRAMKAYRAVLGEKLPDYAPDAYRQAQHDAGAELDALLKRLPSIAVTVRGVRSEEVQVTIDGAPANMATQVPVDPGAHAIAARTLGPSPRQVAVGVSLAPGEHQRIDLDLTPPAPSSAPPVGLPAGPPALAPPFAPAAAARPVFAPRPPERGSVAPAAVAFGAGGAALLAGAVAGGLAVKGANELSAACGAEKVCTTPDQNDQISATRALGNAATALLILGGVGVATGVVLVAVRAARAGRTAVSLGPAGAFVEGAW